MRRGLVASAAFLAALAAPAVVLAASVRWRAPVGAFEAMLEQKVPGVFYFQGYGNIEASLSHKFMQGPVVSTLKKAYCVQIPNINGKGEGRSEDEVKLAKRLGVGRTKGVVVVVAWDGYELARYSDVVETRHFVPIVKGWLKANKKRLGATKKAKRNVEKARQSLLKGAIGQAILKVQHTLEKKVSEVSQSVLDEARELQSELIGRAQEQIKQAKEQIAAGEKDAARATLEQVKKDFGKLAGIAGKADAMLAELDRS